MTPAEVEHCVLRATTSYRTKKNNNYRATVDGRPLRIVVAADRDTGSVKFVVTVIVEDKDDI